MVHWAVALLADRPHLPLGVVVVELLLLLPGSRLRQVVVVVLLLLLLHWGMGALLPCHLQESKEVLLQQPLAGLVAPG